jgi:hypothetical protein
MMAVTMQQVREVLDPEEPDYQRGVALGPEALPHLDVLVSLGDPMLASKATYLASLIQHPLAVDVVEKAARNTDPIVRVAAAAAATNLSSAGESDVLRELDNDPDAGVRKVARSRRRPSRDISPSESSYRSEVPPSVPPVITGRMPGEKDAGDIAASQSMMPGEAPGARSGLMPGERQDSSGGLMPGEKPARSDDAKGEMPD